MSSNHPLAKFRAEKSLTLSALARMLGIGVSTVHRWESGTRNIDPEILPTVVAVTGIPARELRPDLARLFGEAGPCS